MSNLITNYNSASDPENTVKPLEVPRIIASTPRATVTETGMPREQAQLGEILGPTTNALSTLAPNAPNLQGFQASGAAEQMASDAAANAGAQFNWMLNSIQNMPLQFQSPLYRSDYGAAQTSWAPLPLRSIESTEERQRREQAAVNYRQQYGPDAPNPMRNAFRQNANQVGRDATPPRPGVLSRLETPQWLQSAIDRGSQLLFGPADLAARAAERVLGRDLPTPSSVAAAQATNVVEATGSTITNLAALGGGMLQLGYAVADIVDPVTGALFDQSLGRALYGSPAASAERRAEGRERVGTPLRGYLQPSMDLYDEFVPPEGNATPGDVLRLDFGSYGRGLPGAVNWASDYVGSVIGGTGLSLWRGGRTIEHALRGENYEYDWEEPLWQGLNPFDSSQTFSLLESPEYSPLSIQRFMFQGEDLSWSQRALNLGLLATGFIIDSRAPDIGDFIRLNRVARATMGGTDIVLYRPPDAPGGPRVTSPDGLPPSPPEAQGRRALPGTRPEVPALGPGGEPLPPLTGGAQAVPDYEVLFTTEEGIAVELPRDTLQTVDSFILSDPLRDIEPTFDASRTIFEVDLQDNLEQLRRDRLDQAFDRPSAERIEPQPEATPEPEAPPEPAQEPESLPLFPERVVEETPEGRTPEEMPSETPVRPEETPDQERRPELPEESMAPPKAPEGPVRFTAEAQVQKAIDEGSLRTTPDGGFIDAVDDIKSAQYDLINNRLLQRQIESVPEAERSPSMRRTLANLQEEFESLRERIAGRPLRPMEPEAAIPTPEVSLNDTLPVVKQGTLVPPKNPAALYQWSRNLPPEQSIYTPDAELVDRTAKQLTDLARFFGHADIPRGKVLSAEQLESLRYTYGSIYNTVGPELDAAALKTLSIEGVGRVETKRPDPVRGQPQETKLVSNEVMRNPDSRTARPEDFGSPNTYSQTQLSKLSDESIETELSGRFSTSEVYRSGLPDRELADTRNDLLQEQAYRRGENVDDALEYFPDDIQKYAEMNGVNVEDLTDAEYLDFARDATEDARIRSSLNTNDINQRLPDSVQSPLLSPEARSAIEELVIAERNVERSMIEVRHRVELLEELEASMRGPSKQLSDDVLNNNLLPNNLNVGTHAGSRQARIDRIADRASAQKDNILKGRTLRSESQVPEGYKIREVNIDEVFANQEASGLRLDMTDPNERRRVDALKRAYLNGEAVPPMRLGFFTPEDAQKFETSPGYSVVDGRHRLQALKEMGTKTFNALVDGQPDEAVKWYHGTRDSVTDLSQLDSFQTGAARRPLGAGVYFYDNPRTATAAATGFTPANSVGHYAPMPQGSVFTASIENANLLDGGELLTADPELWAGVRNIIRAAFGEDKKGANNAIAATRKKNMPQFYDYIASRFKIGDTGGVDEVRMFELQTQMSNFFLAQGYEGVRFNSDAGNVVNIFDTRLPSVISGEGARVGSPRALDQAVESVNHARAEAAIFGTESSRQLAEQSSFRFGKELRRQLVKRLQEASERVDDAFRRLTEADDALYDVAQRDKEIMKQLEAQADELRRQEFIRDTDLPPCL